jgi:hypothetical protein
LCVEFLTIQVGIQQSAEYSTKLNKWQKTRSHSTVCCYLFLLCPVFQSEFLFYSFSFVCFSIKGFVWLFLFSSFLMYLLCFSFLRYLCSLLFYIFSFSFLHVFVFDRKFLFVLLFCLLIFIFLVLFFGFFLFCLFLFFSFLFRFGGSLLFFCFVGFFSFFSFFFFSFSVYFVLVVLFCSSVLLASFPFHFVLFLSCSGEHFLSHAFG